MSARPAPSPSAPEAVSLPRGGVLAAGALIVGSALVCYANIFGVPFLFDDRLAIADNASVRNLADFAALLSPVGLTTSGRPLLNLTFALNYAWTGEAVWSYHAVNLAIHLLAGLVLFGVVRRTMTVANPAKWGEAALPLGGLIALVWTLHPLQTNAVTYISGRAESLMGLFYLLTFYGLIRASTAERPARWLWLSGLSCAAGMATKETMVTAPALVLLYDRVFFSRSFGTAVAKRRWYYAGLASSWALLAYLMLATHHETPGIGFNAGEDAWSYMLTEFKVVAWYLKLAVWPSPLVFDYGPEILETNFWPVAPFVLLVLAGLVLTIRLFRVGRTQAGFLAAAYFILLSPTSSLVPIVGQPMAENRLYLPLAAVISLGAIALYGRAGRLAGYGFAGVAVLFGGLTFARNRAYQTEVTIWEDAIAGRPRNSRGQLNLAIALAKIPGRIGESIRHNEEALRLKPDYPAALYNLACNLATQPGRAPEAIGYYEAALRLRPDMAEAHNNLANELAKLPGRLPEAIAHCEAALRLKPDYAEAHVNLANELARLPERRPEALAQYEAALRLKPDLVEAHYNYANQLANTPGRQPEAVAQYEAALRLAPNLAQAHKNLALALANLGRLDEAVDHLQTALRLRPDYREAQELLGQIRAAQGK